MEFWSSRQDWDSEGWSMGKRKRGENILSNYLEICDTLHLLLFSWMFQRLKTPTVCGHLFWQMTTRITHRTANTIIYMDNNSRGSDSGETWMKLPPQFLARCQVNWIFNDYNLFFYLTQVTHLLQRSWLELRRGGKKTKHMGWFAFGAFHFGLAPWVRVHYVGG